VEPEYFFKTEDLIIWRPVGMLDNAKVTEFVTFLNEISKKRDPHFSRFIDLSKISGISVNYKNVLPLAQARQSYYVTNFTRKVKMGFLVNNDLTFGMARMYQSLSEDKNMEITISENPEEVATFLEVDRSILDI
jgi:hypothetical protein